MKRIIALLPCIVLFSCTPTRSVVPYDSDLFTSPPAVVARGADLFLAYQCTEGALHPGVVSRFSDGDLLFHINLFISPLPDTHLRALRRLSAREAEAVRAGRAYWLDPDGTRHALELKS